MIRKRLDKKNTLIKMKNFPTFFKSKGGHKVVLGIGGNIGDVKRRFGHLFYYFQQTPFLHIVETTPLLKNPPFGYIEQADFYNALVLVETRLAPKMLLHYLLRVERLFGRKRSFQNAPRRLDIDIIFYENIKMETKTLILPHPEWENRDSVLIPLSYMKRV